LQRLLPQNTPYFYLFASKPYALYYAVAAYLYKTGCKSSLTAKNMAVSLRTLSQPVLAKHALRSLAKAAALPRQTKTCAACCYS
ncbi:hypothetical protein NPIL_689211, partial [Nephila pilipes]